MKSRLNDSFYCRKEGTMGSVTRASFIASLVVGLSVLVAAAAPVGADVITDWNQKALPIVTKYSLGAPAYRDLAIMHLAMYQCVNSIEPRYEPYKTKLDAPATASKEAAAAVPMGGKVAPFAMKRGSQFRPGPPIDLKSREWAENYNEIKAIGAKNSTTRTPIQTETGRLWLYTGPGTFMPLAVQLAQAKGLGVNENARLFTLVAMATADAMVAIFDAKYHYEFWRPITAIRNGDIDGNPQTERDATW